MKRFGWQMIVCSILCIIASFFIPIEDEIIIVPIAGGILLFIGISTLINVNTLKKKSN